MSGTFLWSNVCFTSIISCWLAIWVFYELLKVGYWNALPWVYCSLCLLSCCCLVTRSCPILGDPMGFTLSWSLLKLMSVESVLLSSYLILCRPLLLLLLIVPTIGVFSNESALCIRWSKYWLFSISPSNEYSGLNSFRIDWFDLLSAQGSHKSLFQNHSSKASVLQCSDLFYGPALISVHDYWKNHSFD